MLCIRSDCIHNCAHTPFCYSLTSHNRGDHNVSLFTSRDLATWVNHGPVFQMARSGIPNSILFCPKVLYNEATRLYVLWFNWIAGASFADSFYGVATASTPFGPFTVVRQKVTTLAFQDTGDFNLLQVGYEARSALYSLLPSIDVLIKVE